MILTEAHLHTQIGSLDAVVPPAEIPWLYKKAGYGAIIVTDHYHVRTKERYRNAANEWLDGYRIVRDEAKELNMKVFLGIELRLNSQLEDFLIYGLDEAFFKKNDSLYELTLPELYKYMDSCGFLIYQAHPYRPGWNTSACDPKFIHGVEIYNGSTHHMTDNKKAEIFAKKHSLLQISGSDFHSYEDIGRGGIYIDEAIETEKELAGYLKSHTAKLRRDGM